MFQPSTWLPPRFRVRDLEAAISELNRLGYSCDLLVGDAKWFVPQSRPRVFVVALAEPPVGIQDDIRVSDLRPGWVWRYRAERPWSRMHFYPLAAPANETYPLRSIVERLPSSDLRWWSARRTGKFTTSLSPVQLKRVDALIRGAGLEWRTAYRRTRRGRAVWEVRRDEIAGCLRTARGGSSKQALVEAGDGKLRVRWLTPRECARLQGADNVVLDTVTTNQALFGLGDAVCIPVVRWIADNYLAPILRRSAASDRDLVYAGPV